MHRSTENWMSDIINNRTLVNRPFVQQATSAEQDSTLTCLGWLYSTLLVPDIHICTKACREPAMSLLCGPRERYTMFVRSVSCGCGQSAELFVVRISCGCGQLTAIAGLFVAYQLLQ